MEGKVCNRCKEFRIYGFYRKTKKAKDGYHGICKVCDKKYREENKEYLKEYRLKTKDVISERNKKYWRENKESQKERVSIWRKENAEHIKQYRKNNKERDKQKAREWHETEKGRALTMTKTSRYRSRKKMLEAKFTAIEWIECMETFDNKCCYCGKQSELSLEQDHFIPVNSNGPLVKSNVVPACRSCNASKSDKDFFEWYPTNENYSYERMTKILDYLKINK